MADWSKGMCSLAPQPLKVSYLHYHSAYGHQISQSHDLQSGAHTHKIT